MGLHGLAHPVNRDDKLLRVIPGVAGAHYPQGLLPKGGVDNVLIQVISQSVNGKGDLVPHLYVIALGEHGLHKAHGLIRLEYGLVIALQVCELPVGHPQTAQIAYGINIAVLLKGLQRPVLLAVGPLAVYIVVKALKVWTGQKVLVPEGIDIEPIGAVAGGVGHVHGDRYGGRQPLYSLLVGPDIAKVEGHAASEHCRGQQQYHRAALIARKLPYGFL